MDEAGECITSVIAWNGSQITGGSQRQDALSVRLLNQELQIQKAPGQASENINGIFQSKPGKHHRRVKTKDKVDSCLAALVLVIINVTRHHTTDHNDRNTLHQTPPLSLINTLERSVAKFAYSQQFKLETEAGVLQYPTDGE